MASSACSSSARSPVVGPPAGPPLFPDLLEWIEASGGNLSNVEIRRAASSAGGKTSRSGPVHRGRGLFTTCAMRSGDIIFSVPLSTIVTEHVARKSPVGAAITRYAASAGFKCPARILLTLYIMMERKDQDGGGGGDGDNGSDTTSHAAYIASLPRAYGTPCFVAEHDGGAQLAALAGTPVGIRESARRAEMRQTFNACTACAVSPDSAADITRGSLHASTETK